MKKNKTLYSEYEENTSWNASVNTFSINMPDNETANIKWGK
jgi:hypothetical protein